MWEPPPDDLVDSVDHLNGSCERCFYDGELFWKTMRRNSDLCANETCTEMLKQSKKRVFRKVLPIQSNVICDTCSSFQDHRVESSFIHSHEFIQQ